MIEIPLTQGQVALIDDEDFELVGHYKWYANKHQGQFRAVTNLSTGKGKRKKILMHRLIMEANTKELVDHKNGNTLDNRKENLRLCTQSQNMQNLFARRGSSKYKGVQLVQRVGKWRVDICYDGKQRYIGLFADEIEAAKTYDKAAKELFGEFANLNFKRDK